MNQHRSLPAPRALFVIAAIAMLLLCAASATAQQRTTLTRIEVVGLQRISPEQVVTASGLKPGQSIEASTIDAAADKLMRTGWFMSVDYRVRTANTDSILVFELVEKVAAISLNAIETLGQVVWNGNSVLTAAELSTAFGLRAGDPAPQAKIDEALGRTRTAYASRGYINAEIINVTRNLDGRRTNYQFTIREGQQYRMGVLTITGLNGIEMRSLRSKWTLALNEIFDDSYLEQFRTTVIRPFVATRAQRSGVRSKFEINTKPDTQNHTVDVIITFK